MLFTHRGLYLRYFTSIFSIIVTLFSFQGTILNIDLFVFRLLRFPSKSYSDMSGTVGYRRNAHCFRLLLVLSQALFHRKRNFALSQLTAASQRKLLWWRWGESNSWPPACKAGALPAELHPQISSFHIHLLMFVVGLSGLEPPTSRLSGVRSNRLSYRPMQGFQWVLISFPLFLLSIFFCKCSIISDCTFKNK